MDWQNPFAKWLIRPRLTDENGELEFSGLHFSVRGNLGDTSAIYRIQFLCGLAESREYNITVTTRINKFNILPFSLTTLKTSYENIYDITARLTILDANGVGIPGKTVQKIKVLFEYYCSY